MTTTIAIYFIVWWVVLFAVLPWGVRSQQESGAVVPGSDPGAPTLPRLLMKLAWTTLISAVIFAICAIVYRYRLVTLDDLVRWLGVRL